MKKEKYLCLDLSITSTGYSIFNNLDLKKYGKICPVHNLSLFERSFIISNKLSKLFISMDKLIIEDVYLGITGVKNLISLSRLAGEIIYAWKLIKNNDPLFFKACSVRKLVGLKGNCQKVDVQLFILEHYQFISLKVLSEFKQMRDFLYQDKLLIKNLNNHTKKKKLLTKIKYQFGKLSKTVEKKTGFGNDICDSILLGLGYSKQQRIKKWEN